MSRYLTFSWLSTSPQAEPTGRSHLSSRMHHQGDSKSVDKHSACSLQKRQQAYDFGEATGSGRSAAPSHGLLLKITRHRSQGTVTPQALWGPRHPAQPSPGPSLTCLWDPDGKQSQNHGWQTTLFGVRAVIFKRKPWQDSPNYAINSNTRLWACQYKPAPKLALCAACGQSHKSLRGSTMASSEPRPVCFKDEIGRRPSFLPPDRAWKTIPLPSQPDKALHGSVTRWRMDRKGSQAGFWVRMLKCPGAR